jgi:hypothetical protein
MAADTNAGQVGSTTTPGNQDNLAPADRAAYDKSAFSAQPGAAARANGYPRRS